MQIETFIYEELFGKDQPAIKLPVKIVDKYLVYVDTNEAVDHHVLYQVDSPVKYDITWIKKFEEEYEQGHRAVIGYYNGPNSRSDAYIKLNALQRLKMQLIWMDENIAKKYSFYSFLLSVVAIVITILGLIF